MVDVDSRTISIRTLHTPTENADILHWLTHGVWPPKEGKPVLTKAPSENVSAVLSVQLEDGEWHSARYDVENDCWRLVQAGQEQQWRELGFLVTRIRSKAHARK